MPDPLPGAPTDRPPGPPPETALSACHVVLVRTEGAINLGLIARLCSNLGVAGLRLVSPRVATDDPQAWTFATAWGQPVLSAATVHGDLADALAGCQLAVATSGEFRSGRAGAPVDAADVPALLARRGARRWALVFGAESDGLSIEELDRCQAWLHLETHGPNRSYNLAAAVAIAGYLIAGSSAPSAPEAPPAADMAEVDALAAPLVDALRAARYPRAQRSDYPILLRRLLARCALSDADARALRGIATAVMRATRP